MTTRFIDDDGVGRSLTSVAGQKALNAAIDAITGWHRDRRDYAAILSDAADALDTLPEMCLPRVMRLLNPNGRGFVYGGTVLFFGAEHEVMHTVSIEAPTWALAASLAFVEASRVLKELRVRR
jgi:hypothetical protein